MSESIQHKLDRVRPPRVQITYDVETLGAIQMKELPFVMGIMADLAGKDKDLADMEARDKEFEAEDDYEKVAEGYLPLPKLPDRKFVEIDRDNFNGVLESLLPHLQFTVPNKLVEGDETTDLAVDLYFKSMDDFEPVKVIKQIPALKKLYMARQHLSDLAVKLEGNDKLNSLLTEVVENTAGLEEMKAAKETESEPDNE